MKNDICEYTTNASITMIAWFASLTAALPNSNEPGDLWDNSRLALVCIVGSLAGAILTLAMPHRELTPRKQAGEIFFAFLTGVLFAPFIIEHIGVRRDVTPVVVTSAFVALIGIGLLRALLPLLRSLFVDATIRWFRRVLNLPEEPPKCELPKSS